MKHSGKSILSLFTSCCIAVTCPAFAEGGEEDAEPDIQGVKVVQLIEETTMEGWEVPSDSWSIEEGVIIGDTGAEALKAPEWIYTKRKFADFIFTCEVRLTGELKQNSGIYFRANPIQFTGRKGVVSYEAASGYEFDIVVGRHCGSLGDWYARPKLRVFADPKIITNVYKEDDWNRMTIRARGNRLEYWLNGVKTIDYQDEDPKGSREGVIGLQIHDKALMKVEMKKARILPLSE